MKRYIMELIGTFYLTLVISFTGNPIAIGLMLMILICVGGRLSGAHYNPALSLVVFLQKKMNSYDFMMYLLFQLIGAFIALCFFMIITNNIFVPEVIPGSSVLATLTMEALLTKLLCWVVITLVVLEKTNIPSLNGIIVGLTLMGIVFVGGLFNPAVASASLLCNFFKYGSMGDMSIVFVYIVGPLLGSLMASYAFNFFNSEQR